MRKPLSVAICFACMLPGAAGAAVFAVDTSFGPDSATRSTATGFDWLDLDFTVDSVAAIDARLAPGGDLEDWRRATTAEVVAFWADAGVSVTGVGTLVETMDPAQVAATDALIDLVFTMPLGGGGSIDSAFGFTAEPAADPGQWTSAWLLRRFALEGDDPPVIASAAIIEEPISAAPGFGDAFAGAWLVRPFAVPAPGMLALFGLGALGLAVARRR